jgi:D-alanyl-D-alanine carboxypeptidase
VDGLKTGFTSGAGFCISATALRNGHRVIVVMMDSPDSRTRDLNVQGLISDAFIKLPIAEAQFSKESPGPSQPTRPAPTPAPETGPVIHVPGPGGR